MTNKPTELVDHVMSLVPQAYADIKLNLSDAVICYGNAEGCVREDGCEDNCLMLATYRKGVEFGATTAHRLASTAPASEDEVREIRAALDTAIAALRPRSEREEIANWLREDAPQWGHEALANAIERGDFKEPGE